MLAFRVCGFVEGRWRRVASQLSSADVFAEGRTCAEGVAGKSDGFGEEWFEGLDKS